MPPRIPPDHLAAEFGSRHRGVAGCSEDSEGDARDGPGDAGARQGGREAERRAGQSPCWLRYRPEVI